jgi:hypothetical protein
VALGNFKRGAPGRLGHVPATVNVKYPGMLDADEVDAAMPGLVESSPHTRSANALAYGVASQVALARRFNIRVMLRIEKTEALTKTMLLLMFGWKPRIGTLILPHCKVVRELIAKLNCGNVPVK